MIKMAEQGVKEAPKKKAKVKAEAKSSVKSYERGIEVEKQNMGAYSKKFGATVRSLQADFKSHQKELKEAALKMHEEGKKKMNSKINQFKGEMKAAAKLMNDKVNKFNSDVKSQISENKEAVSRIEKGTKFLLSEINKKKREFKAYAHGPFRDYIKAFWGVNE